MPYSSRLKFIKRRTMLMVIGVRFASHAVFLMFIFQRRRFSLQPMESDTMPGLLEQGLQGNNFMQLYLGALIKRKPQFVAVLRSYRRSKSH